MASYQLFIEKVKEIHKIGAIQGHLGWDQETIMPPKGAKARSEILSWLAKEQHARVTDSDFGEMITQLEKASDLDENQLANVREMRRRYDKAVKLPSDFVANYALARSQALVAWQEARAASDFTMFQPHLEKLVEMTNQKIDYYGVDTTRYDVLLDEYEFGMKVSDYDPLFAGLKSRLVPLLQNIMEAKKINPDPTLPNDITFPVEAQTEFCKLVSNAMGFDFEAGRMDASTHPFSAGLWPGDTRFTTRFDEQDPFSCLYAVMHETGPVSHLVVRERHSGRGPQGVRRCVHHCDWIGGEGAPAPPRNRRQSPLPRWPGNRQPEGVDRRGDRPPREGQSHSFRGLYDSVDDCLRGTSRDQGCCLDGSLHGSYCRPNHCR